MKSGKKRTGGELDPDDILKGRVSLLNRSCPQGEKTWVLKIMALANFGGAYDDDLRIDETAFPPFIVTWSEERLGEVARQVRQWLDQQVQMEENGNEEREINRN